MTAPDPFERKAVPIADVPGHLREGWQFAEAVGEITGDLDLIAMRRLKADAGKPLWRDDAS